MIHIARLIVGVLYIIGFILAGAIWIGFLGTIFIGPIIAAAYYGPMALLIGYSPFILLFVYTTGKDFLDAEVKIKRVEDQ